MSIPELTLIDENFSYLFRVQEYPYLFKFFKIISKMHILNAILLCAAFYNFFNSA